MTKMTRKDKFEKVIEILNTTEIDNEIKSTLIEFCETEIEKINNKRNTPTKTQKANAIVKDNIVEYLINCEEPQTASEIWKNGFAEYSVQKIIQLLTGLVKDEKITRTKEGKNPAVFFVE